MTLTGFNFNFNRQRRLFFVTYSCPLIAFHVLASSHVYSIQLTARASDDDDVNKDLLGARYHVRALTAPAVSLSMSRQGGAGELERKFQGP